MKLTTTIASLFLAVLAPVVASEGLLGFVAIADSENEQNVLPASENCFAYPGGPTTTRFINVVPLEDTPAIRCTFFTSATCDGDQITLNTGEHQFRRDLVVGSWECEPQA
ncbi:hypothetical protein BJY01DRAFT_185753 [Aspergillus pseudoustus]|uniref:Uncharacterized protein n=1 Tax=Aspergillus pseudoustus TaxID=1810923 RepID=A0ABR4JXG6_9EURO